MSENKFIDGINKTGFGLEFSISKTLIADGWTVINNKYYIDDVQGSAREIDILAYKVSLKDEIQIYTVLIISCKKSIENSVVPTKQCRFGNTALFYFVTT